MEEMQQDVAAQVNNSMPDDVVEKKGIHVGPVMAILIVLVCLSLGGMYLWTSMLDEEETGTENVAPVRHNKNVAPTNQGEVSDELNTLEKDLTSDASSTDANLAEIDAAFEASR